MGNCHQLKKGSFIGVLFALWAPLLGQVTISKPLRTEALNPQETVEVKVQGEVKRVELYLNGRVLGARGKAPFTFDIHWDLSVENTLKAVALLQDGSKLVTQKTYRPIQVDMIEKVAIRDFFIFSRDPVEPNQIPFTDAPGQIVTLRQAADAYPLEVVFVVDCSGSMQPYQKDMATFLTNLVPPIQQIGNVSMIGFDQVPFTISPIDPSQFGNLVTSKPNSAIFDSLASALSTFPASPRRILVLITDGYDDISKHNRRSLAQLVKDSGASLLWYNPSRLSSYDLDALVKGSGGDSNSGQAKDAAQVFFSLMQQQLHIQIETPQGKIPFTHPKYKLISPHWTY